MKIKDAYNKAVNNEKYIQKLKLEVAQLMHIQEEKKETIREKKEDLVHATWLVARSRSKKKMQRKPTTELKQKKKKKKRKKKKKEKETKTTKRAAAATARRRRTAVMMLMV